MTDSIAMTSRRVATWGECDPAGIVYTPRFADWTVEALEMLFSSMIGISWPQLHRSLGLGAPMVALKIEFSSSVRPGDEVEIHLRIVKIGRTSLTAGITGSVDGTKCFSSEITTVFVDTRTNLPAPIPQSIRERLSSIGTQGAARL
jgi:4-hydroxybenzoyl-CoA thioesterase